MIKGALFDIDDTLFSHELNAVPKATIKALDKLRAKGIKIGICTSRVAVEMLEVPDELLSRIDCKIVGTGATTVVDNRYFKSYTIPLEDARRYTRFFEENRISYDYADVNGDLYFWGDIDKVNKGKYLRLAGGNVKFKEYEDEQITNLFYFEAPEDKISEIDAINPDALISKWGNSGNICASLVDKSFGLLKFCQVYSFTTDEIVAAGDGINDDVMLEMAGIGIATDDAKENTKAAADYICRKSIEDGGLYDALIDLKIIEEDAHDIRMFSFDLDSTLFDHKFCHISDLTIKALKALKAKDKILCLNTSRSYEELYNIPDEVLDLMDDLCLLDGAYIRNRSGCDIAYLKPENVRKIVSFMDEHGITYRYCTDDGKGYLNQHDEDKEALFYRLYKMVPEIKKYDGEKVVQFLYYATGELREQVIALAEEESCFLLNFGGEISPAGTSKGGGMLKIAEKYGISRKNICAYGDSYNDIDMLQKAGLGIAMGNGQRECKNAADYIAEDISEEGFYKSLLHFGFIEE
ncbi:MAG: HAD family phosphatase [Erysipelotrichaceae bacterium]|nr:HAD family phosphatase [Erysipelotrichaceae bacterium]